MEEREKKRQEEERETKSAARAQQLYMARWKRETLSEEASSRDGNVLFRFPNIEKHQRRFCLSDPLPLLFHAYSMLWMSGVPVGCFLGNIDRLHSTLVMYLSVSMMRWTMMSHYNRLDGFPQDPGWSCSSNPGIPGAHDRCVETALASRL